MRRWVLLMLMLVMAAVLVGCGSKTSYQLDDAGNMAPEPSFFASENLAAHYSAMGAQTQELIGLHRGNPYETRTEQVLGGIVTALLVEKVSLMPAPKTMADVFDRNLTGWLSLGLQAYQVIDGNLGRRSGSPNLEIKGTGNNLIFDSQLGTGEGSLAHFWLGDYDYQQLDLDVSGLGASGNLDASRPYTYDYDWTRTETRIESPSSEDSGLF